jgi:hypothetical protein
VDGTGAGSFLMIGFGISDVEPSTSTNTALVTYKPLTHQIHATEVLNF